LWVFGETVVLGGITMDAAFPIDNRQPSTENFLYFGNWRKDEMDSIPWAALAPVLVVALAFVVYCWIDIARTRVKYLPKWAWAIICVISVPLGGIVYLLIGRDS
jgi:hypothetical protein